MADAPRFSERPNCANPNSGCNDSSISGQALSWLQDSAARVLGHTKTTWSNVLQGKASGAEYAEAAATAILGGVVLDLAGVSTLTWSRNTVAGPAGMAVTTVNKIGLASIAGGVGFLGAAGYGLYQSEFGIGARAPRLDVDLGVRVDENLTNSSRLDIPLRALQNGDLRSRGHYSPMNTQKLQHNYFGE